MRFTNTQQYPHLPILWVVIAIVGTMLSVPAHAKTLPDSLSLRFGAVSTVWVGSATVEQTTVIDHHTVRAFRGEVSHGQLSRAVFSVLSRLADDGYRNASVSPRDFVVDGDYLNLTLQIVPGQRSVVHAYSFSGLTSTDTAWLHRAVALPLGVPLTKEWTRIAQERLAVYSHIAVAGTPAVQTIRELPEEQSAQVEVIFNVRELAPSRFDGLIAAGGQGADTELTGQASLQFGGLFGRDRALTINYDRQRPEWTALNIGYAENGTLGAPLGWAIEFDELTRGYRRQSIRSQLKYAFSNRRSWTIGIGGLWRRVTPNTASVSAARITELNVSLARQSRIKHHNQGARIALTIDVALSRRRDIGSVDSSSNTTRLRVVPSAHLGVPVTNSLRLIAEAAGQWWPSGSEELGPGDEWYLGGAEMLRGYESQSFAAVSGAWGSLELERQLGSGASMSVFGELAGLTFASQSIDSRVTVTPHSLGWALSLRSTQRFGRLELAWGKGVSLRDGLLRLKISQAW